MIIIWTDYIKDRIKLREYEYLNIEEIVRYSDERYYDVSTGRMVVIGRHDDRLVIIPYEEDKDSVTPVTVHAITRQQIKYRIRTGRFSYEKA